jgi:hypothetical protein
MEPLAAAVAWAREKDCEMAPAHDRRREHAQWSENPPRQWLLLDKRSAKENQLSANGVPVRDYAMAPVQEALMARVRLCRRHRPKYLEAEI